MLCQTGFATEQKRGYMQATIRAIVGARLEIVHDSFDPTNLCQRAIFDRLLSDFLQQIGWTSESAADSVQA